MKKKGQLGGIVYFVGIVICLILLAPIMLKIITTLLGTTSTQLATMDSSNKSSAVVGFVMNKATGVFDWVIMVIIILDVLLLMVSAFLIDVNPAFVIFYIIGVFALVLSAPYAIMSAEKLYSMDTFSGINGVTQYLPMTEFIMNNFGVFLVGIIVLTGIIIYAKIRFFSQNGNSGGTY